MAKTPKLTRASRRKPALKSLRVGDQVRFVQLPIFEGQPGGGL
jgi:hypothetical protein